MKIGGTMRLKILLCAAVLLSGGIAHAQSKQALEGQSGLKVPRFVSLSASEANLRTGPGENYPVAWVYRRKGLPVEVIAEYNIWRQIRDPDGVKGWVNKNLLSGARTGLVVNTIRTAYTRADLQSPPAFRVEPGAIVTIEMCEEDWCRVESGKYSGFLMRNQIWGTYRNEEID